MIIPLKPLMLVLRLRKQKIHSMVFRRITSDSSDEEDKEVYASKFVWPVVAKPCSCASLEPTQNNRQEEMMFTFDVSKCGRIFDELLRLGHLKITCVIYGWAWCGLLQLIVELIHRNNPNGLLP